MAYDPGAIDATLAAAVGDEPLLIAELRGAFIDSARRVLTTMETATGEQWAGAAFRLKGLAASFGAIRLMTLAAEAALAPVGDQATLRRLHRAIDRF